jgi:hypothetical protein
VNVSFSELVHKSAEAIDISGYTLHLLVENQRLLDALVQRARNKVAIRTLLCAPENPAVPLSVQGHDCHGMKSEMKTTRTMLLNAQARLSDEERPYLSVRRLKNAAMSASIFRVDNRLSIVHYLRKQFTAGTPVFVVERGWLFNTYLAEFDELFKLGDKDSEVDEYL